MKWTYKRRSTHRQAGRPDEDSLLGRRRCRRPVCGKPRSSHHTQKRYGPPPEARHRVVPERGP
jgi:hypothetical protein